MDDDFPLLRWALDSLRWAEQRKAGPAAAPDPTLAADQAFAHELELAREVCEDAEVDALQVPPGRVVELVQQESQAVKLDSSALN